jgi:tetratricopeptide (TPR) repeat protein
MPGAVAPGGMAPPPVPAELQPVLRGDAPSGAGMLQPPQVLDLAILDLRRRRQRRPDYLQLANDLGRRLEERADVERGRHLRDRALGIASARPYLQEARDLYLQAAEGTPLRIYQATFYASAAGVHQKLDEWEEEYRLLRRALELAPHSVSLWRQLQVVSLRTGRLHESRVARQQVIEWTVPALRAREP